MNHDEFNKCFADAMERDRILMGYTQTQMADELGISISAYKRIVSYDTDKIDLYLCYKMYKLTHKFAYELVGYSDTFVDTVTLLRSLRAEELDIVNDLAKMLTSARQYTDRHREMMEAYLRLNNEDKHRIDDILGEAYED